MDQTMTATRGANSIVWLLALAFLALIVLAALPDVAIGPHAVERHGEDALYALNSAQRGDCCWAYRHIPTNRMVRVCKDATLGGLLHVILQTLSGCPVTAYDATPGYCTKRFGAWEYLGAEGWCGD